MNTLTMVFVVIVAVLSIFLVALVVPFVAKTENYKQMYQEERQAKVAAEALAQLKDAEITAYASLQDAKILQQTGQINELQGENSSLKNDRAAAALEIQELKAKVASLEAGALVANASIDNLSKIAGKDRDELNDLRAKKVSSDLQLIQLAQKNDELDAMVASLNRSVRQGNEIKAELEAANKELAELIAKIDPRILEAHDSGQNVDQEPYPAPYPIDGNITILQDVMDQTLVQLNVGSNDGVGENMKFLVHRDGVYLGKVVITKVDTDVSAGRLETVEPGKQVAPGDSVLTGPVSN